MRCLLLLLLVAGCDSPTPAVARWQRATVEVGGMVFGVHWAGEKAEAYRTSKHLRPKLGEVQAKAALAIARASGCRVREIGGDHAIVMARLDC
jgi:hypothetical protein